MSLPIDRKGNTCLELITLRGVNNLLLSYHSIYLLSQVEEGVVGKGVRGRGLHFPWQSLLTPPQLEAPGVTIRSAQPSHSVWAASDAGMRRPAQCWSADSRSKEEKELRSIRLQLVRCPFMLVAHRGQGIWDQESRRRQRTPALAFAWSACPQLALPLPPAGGSGLGSGGDRRRQNTLGVGHFQAGALCHTHPP